MNMKEEQLLHNLASRIAPSEGLVTNYVREQAIERGKKVLAEHLLPLLEAMRRKRIGWMDSTDFAYELGHARGGSKVYADEEDCKKNCPCVAHPDMTQACEAQRVVVLNAEEWDHAWAKLESIAW